MKSKNFYKKIGNYNLIKEIGTGSFARVYKGVQESTGTDVAIKMVSKQGVSDYSLNLIEKEIDILLRLNHSNIIRLIDYKRTVNNFYLIFEYCEHGDLDNYLKNNTENKRLPEKEVKIIVKQIVNAMEKMNSLRIVHRDLKLANILINKDFQVKLADFGFAKYSNDESFLQSYCGTPLTMAPEVLKREKYNEKCDIWSIGVIIYQLLFGIFPFNPPKGGMVNDLIKIINTQEVKFPESIKVSNEVKILLKSLLQKDWRERFSPQQFFKSAWIQEENLIEDAYLKSLYKSNTITPQISQQSLHTKKPSDVIVEDVQKQSEKQDSPTLEEQDNQLKYIAGLLSQELRCFMQKYIEKLWGIDEICKQVRKLKQLSNPLPQIHNLYLSIRILKGAYLQEGLEYCKEQIIVIQNTTMNCDLVSLQIKAPIIHIQERMSEMVSQLKEEFSVNQQFIDEFSRQKISIVDNIYNCFLDLISVMNKQNMLDQMDMSILDLVFDLLKHLTINPPVEQTLQFKIQVLDVEKYWSLFKLIKSNYERLQTLIEQNESSKLDLGIQLQIQIIPKDPEYKNISFKAANLIPIRNAIIEIIKSHQTVIIG